MSLLELFYTLHDVHMTSDENYFRKQSIIGLLHELIM